MKIPDANGKFTYRVYEASRIDAAEAGSDTAVALRVARSPASSAVAVEAAQAYPAGYDSTRPGCVVPDMAMPRMTGSSSDPEEAVMNQPTKRFCIALLAVTALCSCSREAPNPRGAESADDMLPPPPAAPPEASPSQTADTDTDTDESSQ